MDEIVIVLAFFVFIIDYFGISDKLLSKLHSAIFITIWLSISTYMKLILMKQKSFILVHNAPILSGPLIEFIAFSLN